MKKSSKVTLCDIAKRANLSVSAVSLALRDHPSISEESKQRIARIGKELGYRQPSKSSGTGQTRPSLNLAYCLVGESLQDQAYVPIAHGIINACRKWEAHLAIQDIPAGILSAKPVTMASGDDPSGYLLMGFLTDDLVAHFKKMGKPVIVMGTNPLSMDITVVRPDTLEAGRRIAHKALEDGYKKFVYITSNLTAPHNIEVLQGVRAGLVDSGLSLDDDRVLVASEFEVHETKHLQRVEKLTKGPTAIIAAGVVTANACASVFHAKGWMDSKNLCIYCLVPSKTKRINPLYKSLNMGLERIGEISVDVLVQKILGYHTCSCPYVITLPALDWLDPSPGSADR